MRHFLLAILLSFALALAGCTSSPDDAGDDAGDGTGDGTGNDAGDGTGDAGGANGGGGSAGGETGNPGGEGTPPAGGNQAPVVELTATNVTIAPAQEIAITLNATDADNDTLSWDLDLDGDGVFDETGFDDLPREFVGSYPDEGTYVIAASVTDGTAVSNATLTISVVAPPAPEGPEPVVYSGTVTTPSPSYLLGAGCFEDIAISFFGFLPGADTWNYYPVPEAVWGTPYTLEGVDVIADFWNRDGAAKLGEGTSGTVPEGATFVFVCASAPTTALHDFTLTLSAPA